MTTRKTVDPQFTRPGRGAGAKPIVLFAGLLDTAHDNGLASIATELLQLDLERRVAVVRATATLVDSDGTIRTFQGLGDCSPENAGQVGRDHWIRMAETRAKARALRDAINVGDCAIEGDVDEDDPPPFQQQPSRPPTPHAVRPPPPPAPVEQAAPPASDPNLLQHPDVVDAYDDDGLVEAVTLMATKLEASGIKRPPVPQPRARLSWRRWYREGYQVLTQPELIAAPAAGPRSHYDEGAVPPRRRS